MRASSRKLGPEEPIQRQLEKSAFPSCGTQVQQRRAGAKFFSPRDFFFSHGIVSLACSALLECLSLWVEVPGRVRARDSVLRALLMWHVRILYASFLFSIRSWRWNVIELLEIHNTKRMLGEINDDV